MKILPTIMIVILCSATLSLLMQFTILFNIVLSNNDIIDITNEHTVKEIGTFITFISYLSSITGYVSFIGCILLFVTSLYIVLYRTFCAEKEFHLSYE